MIDRRTFIGGGIGLMAGATLAPRLRAASAATPHILLVYVSGGWDTTMVFDDKRSSTFVTSETGAREGLTTSGLHYVDHPSRPAVKSFFDNHGANVAIANGISIGSMTRLGALESMWGLVPPGKRRAVDWLSYYVASLNPGFDIPHAVIGAAPYMPGDYASVAIRLAKETIAARLVDIPNADELGEAGETALKSMRATTYETATKDINSNSLDGEKMRALYYSSVREPLIKTRLTEADATLGPQNSDSDFVRHGKLAIELFASGASFCATVQAGATNHWDTRSQNFDRQTTSYQELFEGLTAILDYAQTRSIADKLTVIVMSERGRAPRVDEEGGKSPWPVTSVMLCGTGVNGGAVVNATDDALRALPVSPLFGTDSMGSNVTLTMSHVFAALFLRFGVSYKLAMPQLQPLTPIISGAS